MPKIVENSKNFKVVEVTDLDVMKWGGVGICDHCLKRSKTFLYIAVMDHCICQECYNSWIIRAKNYPEDHAFETRKFEWIMKFLEDYDQK